MEVLPKSVKVLTEMEMFPKPYKVLVNMEKLPKLLKLSAIYQDDFEIPIYQYSE